MSELSDAVDKLTLPREVSTLIKDEDGTWVGVHSEIHPPLLTLLIEGTGESKGPKSSEDPLPIDADALELWGQVRDMIRLWCKKLRVPFSDDLNDSVRVWYSAHADGVRSDRVGPGTDQDVTRMVEGWVRMVEQKFDPPVKREWKARCVGSVPTTDEDGEPIIAQCAARRIILNGSEVFAIEVNVTEREARCRACGTTWSGMQGLAELRYLTNLDEAVTVADSP